MIFVTVDQLSSCTRLSAQKIKHFKALLYGKFWNKVEFFMILMIGDGIKA
jgi:hypothetical protein